MTSTRRSARDWVVDVCLFLLAALSGLVLAGIRVETGTQPDPAWLFLLDQTVGAAGCAALWLRRRWPVELAVVLVVVSTFSEVVAGAMLVALFTVAVHRPPRVSGAVFALSLLSTLVYVWLRPEPELPMLAAWLTSVAGQGAAIGWGLSIHHRRKLLDSLRERAERAEVEAGLRAEQAQHHARDAIAREIHDVLGHRLSLLSVHAGALEIRPGAPEADVARATGVIRESAHQALQDLRDVVGVLRAPVGELPQPTLADLPELVEESRRAGMVVELRGEIPGPVSDLTGRTAYRIVQEALTNARKHAPGAAVRIELGDDPTVDVVNTAAAPPTATGGLGLAGLTERVALLGGRLEFGPPTTKGGACAPGCRDDHRGPDRRRRPPVRSGLAMMLGGHPDIEIVAEATDGSEVPALIAAHAPAVVLMDIRMRTTDGLTATEALRARPGAPEVIVLTTFDADAHVLRALRAGAAGSRSRTHRRVRSSTRCAGSRAASRSCPRRSPGG